MWVFQNDSFVSVVAHRQQKDRLLVRSRVEGDIQRAIPSAKVFEDDKADYRFRAVATRAQLRSSMSAAVDRIDYDNFKDSIAKTGAGKKRHEAYMGVWSTMARWYGAFGLDRWGSNPRFDEREFLPVDEDPDVDAYTRGDQGDLRLVFPGRPNR